MDCKRRSKIKYVLPFFRVVDPDPHRVLFGWIRVQERKNDIHTKEKFRNFMFFIVRFYVFF
jgi:hypothetical protein